MVRELIHSLRRLVALPLVLMLVGASGAAWADPPGRAGRISLIDGELAVRRDASRGWESASVNWPVTRGDEFATEADSRAEIRIGSSVLRLDENTTVEFLRLDDERIRVRLAEGSVTMRVRSADREAAIEVETRDGLAVPTEPGRYRVDSIDAATLVTNYRGHIDFRTDDRHVSVTDGRRAQIWGDGRTQVVWDGPDTDDFADWSLARDERDDRLARDRYVSPEMTGAEDLYEYGDWREYPDYGPVWFPRSVPSGWAPYRYGRWIWVEPWGWTWVDDAPWGFAPFHYGRWVLIGGAWAWVPGRFVARPIYAPALVAFVGTPGVTITFTSRVFPRHVRWFPLAPHEVFVPHFRHSPTFVRQINITHVTKVIEIERVVKEPRRARHFFGDRHDAITHVSERVLHQPRPLTIDVERRRERRIAEWERRGFRVRDERRVEDRREDRRERLPDGMQRRGGDGAVAPLVVPGARDRGGEPVQIPPRAQEQREESRRQEIRERMEREQQERREEREQRQAQQQERQERIEALRQQQAREREERAREQAAQQEEQERRRRALGEEREQRREEMRQMPREESTNRREQQAREREAQQAREQAARQEEQERRQALREQREQQREEARQAQREEMERRQQQVREREERARGQAAAQAQEQERRREAMRQQAEMRQQMELQREQARQIQRREMEERQREQEVQQQQLQQRHAERMRERAQREAQQQERRGGEAEDPRARRRPPFGQFEGGRPVE